MSSLRLVGNFSGPRYVRQSFYKTARTKSYDAWLHSSSPLNRRPVSLFLCCTIRASRSGPANETWDESSRLPALLLTSLHIKVCASKMSLFRDAALPGFSGTGRSSAVS